MRERVRGAGRAPLNRGPNSTVVCPKLSETLTGSIDRDFGAPWKLLGALLTLSLTLIFFQDVFVLFFDPLGVDFELPR